MSAPDLVCVRSPRAPGPFSTTELLFCGGKKKERKKRGKEGGGKREESERASSGERERDAHVELERDNKRNRL